MWLTHQRTHILKIFLFMRMKLMNKPVNNSTQILHLIRNMACNECWHGVILLALVFLLALVCFLLAFVCFLLALVCFLLAIVCFLLARLITEEAENAFESATAALSLWAEKRTILAANEAFLLIRKKVKSKSCFCRFNRTKYATNYQSIYILIKLWSPCLFAWGRAYESWIRNGCSNF